MHLIAIAWHIDTPLENLAVVVLLIVLAGGMVWIADQCITDWLS